MQTRSVLFTKNKIIRVAAACVSRMFRQNLSQAFTEINCSGTALRFWRKEPAPPEALLDTETAAAYVNVPPLNSQ